MKTRTLLIGIILAGWTVSCSSGKKQFEKGNYRQALHQAIHRLQNSPQNKKATETLARAYPMALKFYQQQIDRKLNSNDPHKWEWIVVHYQDLNTMYEAIQRSPVAQDLIANPQPFYEQLQEAQWQAAETRYQWGIQALEQATKPQARQAFEHFQAAQNMIPGFKDTSDKMLEAREKGTVKVLVDMVPLPSRYYRVDADFFQDDLTRYLASFESNRFLDFVSPQDYQHRDHDWDQILKLQFEDFVVGHTHVHHKQKEVSRDSVSIGTVTLDDGSQKEVFGTVKATLNRFKKEVVSEGLVSLQVIDAHTGGVLQYHEFPGAFTWVSEWGHYNGDRRALNRRQLQLCARREELPPPPQALFHEFTKPIHRQVTDKIHYLYGSF